MGQNSEGKKLGINLKTQEVIDLEKEERELLAKLNVGLNEKEAVLLDEYQSKFISKLVNRYPYVKYVLNSEFLKLELAFNQLDASVNGLGFIERTIEPCHCYDKGGLEESGGSIANRQSSFLKEKYPELYILVDREFSNVFGDLYVEMRNLGKYLERNYHLHTLYEKDYVLCKGKIQYLNGDNSFNNFMQNFQDSIDDCLHIPTRWSQIVILHILGLMNSYDSYVEVLKCFTDFINDSCHVDMNDFVLVKHLENLNSLVKEFYDLCLPSLTWVYDNLDKDTDGSNYTEVFFKNFFKNGRLFDTDGDLLDCYKNVCFYNLFHKYSYIKYMLSVKYFNVVLSFNQFGRVLNSINDLIDNHSFRKIGNGLCVVDYPTFGSNDKLKEKYPQLYVFDDDDFWNLCCSWGKGVNDLSQYLEEFYSIVNLHHENYKYECLDGKSFTNSSFDVPAYTMGKFLDEINTFLVKIDSPWIQLIMLRFIGLIVSYKKFMNDLSVFSDVVKDYWDDVAGIYDSRLVDLISQLNTLSKQFYESCLPAFTWLYDSLMNEEKAVFLSDGKDKVYNELNEDFDKKIYADGFIAKSDLISSDGFATHIFDADIVEIYLGIQDDMVSDITYFRFRNGNLCGVNGDVYIETKFDKNVNEKLIEDYKNPNLRLFLKEHEGISYVVCDAFYHFLASQKKWKFANGRFEEKMAERMQNA